MNNAAGNTGVQISLLNSDLTSSDMYPEVELLDHTIALFLIFGGTSILFSIVAVSTYNLTNSAQRFPLPHILTNFYLFDNSNFNRCEMIAHCGFDLHFLFFFFSNIFIEV